VGIDIEGQPAFRGAIDGGFGIEGIDAGILENHQRRMFARR
jgi:hypothetical protein